MLSVNSKKVGLTDTSDGLNVRLLFIRVQVPLLKFSRQSPVSSEYSWLLNVLSELKVSLVINRQVEKLEVCSFPVEQTKTSFIGFHIPTIDTEFELESSSLEQDEKIINPIKIPKNNFTFFIRKSLVLIVCKLNISALLHLFLLHMSVLFYLQNIFAQTTINLYSL